MASNYNRAKSYARNLSLSQWSIASSSRHNGTPARKHSHPKSPSKMGSSSRRASERLPPLMRERHRSTAGIRVKCPHKSNGCEWVGDSEELNYHIESCTKRSWRCRYCNFVSTAGMTPRDHVPQCSKYPVPCPNGCEAGSIARDDIDKHLSECPLEPVECEFSDAGCSTKIARRYLPRHLEACQQQHVLSATLLNLKMTKEAIAEKDRVITEKDEIIARKDHQLAKRERIIMEKDKQLSDKDKELAEKDRVIAERDTNAARMEERLLELYSLLKKQTGGVNRIMASVDHLLMGGVCHKITLRGFSACQKKGDFGDWYSDPIYSHPGGYKLRLNIATNGAREVRNTHMSVLLILLKGESDGKLSWPVTFAVTLRLLNQFEGGSHFEKVKHCFFAASASSKNMPSFIMFKEFIPLEMLRKDAQFLKNDTLYFHFIVHTL